MLPWALRLAIDALTLQRLPILLLFSLAVGCGGDSGLNRAKPVQHVWTVNEDHLATSLTGGKWFASDPSSYYMKGGRNVSLIIELRPNQRFIFDEVRHVYATRSGTKLVRIAVAGYGCSKREAIERVEKFHLRWQGDGLDDDDIKKWIQMTDRGSFTRHNSIVRLDSNPEIILSILYNFGDKPTNKWFVMTTFYWGTESNEAVSNEIVESNRRSN